MSATSWPSSRFREHQHGPFESIGEPEGYGPVGYQPTRIEEEGTVLDQVGGQVGCQVDGDGAVEAHHGAQDAEEGHGGRVRQGPVRLRPHPGLGRNGLDHGFRLPLGRHVPSLPAAGRDTHLLRRGLLHRQLPAHPLRAQPRPLRHEWPRRHRVQEERPRG